MIYREYLVMRKALVWFACIVLALMLLNFIGTHVMAADSGVFSYGSAAFTAGIFAAAFAWIFGVALGNGSREAARVLWVLPEARWKLALQILAVDLAGTTVAYACEYAAMLVFFAIAHLASGVQVHGTVSAHDIILTLAFSYAIYGWSALTGMLGRRVPYCGIVAAPALAIWMTVAESHLGIAALLRAPISANPFAVFNTALAIIGAEQYHYALDTVSSSLLWLGTRSEAPVLLAIAVVTCGLAVALWQRAEAIS